MTQIPMVTGMSWYNREDYPALLELFADGAALPRTYDEWLQAAELGFKRFQEKGYRVVKITITPGEIKTYGETRGMEIDNKARSAFGNERLKLLLDRGELDMS